MADNEAERGAQADDVETVGELAELYLGNIMYALELAAVTLDGDGKSDHAAYYRGIARKLAQARARARGAAEA